MGYNTKELKEKAIDALDKYGLYFIEDIAAHLGISKTTFYAHGLNELDEIKDKVWINKRRRKMKMRERWEKSGNPTLEIAHYRLLSDPDELIRLSKQHVDVTSKDEKIM